MRSVVRRVVRGHEIPSNRVRTASEEGSSAKLRQSVVLYELQGDLVFATAEKAHRTIVAGLDDVEFVVVDFRYVTSIDEPARAVLNTLAGDARRDRPHRSSPRRHPDDRHRREAVAEAC